MTAANPPLTLTLPTDLRMLSVARAFVEAVCHICELDNPTTHAIVLATGEAVSNIIRHAHQGRPEAQLQILCMPHVDAIEIVLLDEGEPFDLSSVPHLDPAELRLGGRGVFLMRALMDELCSTPRTGRGNALRMLKRRSGRSPIRDVG